jgi:hypothetical protein
LSLPKPVLKQARRQGGSGSGERTGYSTASVVDQDVQWRLRLLEQRERERGVHTVHAAALAGDDVDRWSDVTEADAWAQIPGPGPGPAPPPAPTATATTVAATIPTTTVAAAVMDVPEPQSSSSRAQDGMWPSTGRGTSSSSSGISSMNRPAVKMKKGEISNNFVRTNLNNKRGSSKSLQVLTHASVLLPIVRCASPKSR